MLVVADTSPLYSKIVVPLEVRAELLAADAPPAVRSWALNLPAWVEVCAPDPALLDDPRWRSLDRREPGATIARSQGFAVIGTLGVLDEAARRELI